jgi:hypothetical protein
VLSSFVWTTSTFITNILIIYFNFNLLHEEGNNLDFSVSTNEAGQRGISSCWKISIASVKDEKKLITLSIKMPKLAGKNIS